MGGSSIIIVGAAVPISLLLADGDAGKFPRAFVYDQSGALLITIDLTHSANGLYVPASVYSMPDRIFITVVFIVYDDALFAVESTKYNRVSDTFQKADYSTLASTIDGAQTLQSVLSRLNSMAAGKVVRTGTRYAYRDEGDSSTLFTNDDQDAQRVPV
jgi:hypothetical protein